MLSKIKKLAKATYEVPVLRARSMGMGFIESRIAESIGSPAIAKVITQAFGLKGIDKKAQQAAKKKLKDEYGTDPRLESMFGRGGFGGDDEVGSKTINKKLNEIKKILLGMVQEVASVSKKLDAVGEQNDQILKAAQSRLAQEIGQIMQMAPPAVQPELPVGTEKSEGGIIVPQEKEKLVEKTAVEKETQPEAMPIPATEDKPAEAPVSEPTATPKKEFDKKETIVSKTLSFMTERLEKRYPILKVLSDDKKGEKSTVKSSDKESEKKETESSKQEMPTLGETKPSSTSPETLQPALEGIAEKKPIQSTIEPDELQEMLKEALSDALNKLKSENPDLFKGEGGGLLDNLGGGIAGMLGRGAKGVGKAVKGAAKKVGTATKAAGKGIGKVLGKSVLKSALKKIPIVGAVAGLGFAASRAIKGDWAGAAMEAGSGLAGTVPGLGTAASVGIDAALAARDAGALGGGATPVPQKPEDPQLSTAVPTSSGAEIIEMNRRIESGEVAVRSTPQGTPIVQRITNNNVLPTTEKKDTIEVGNRESTFNRLIAQDFDHPAAYSNFNMG